MSKSNALPNGWSLTTLAEIAQPREERILPVDFPSLPYIGMEQVEPHTTRIIGRLSSGSVRSSCMRFYPGDVLYGRLRPYLNKVIAPDFEGLASAEFIVLPTLDGLSSSFLMYRLNSRDFVEFANSLNSGDRPRVSFSQIGKFPVELPPANEQTRIVAKLQKLLSDLDSSMAELQATKTKLAHYRKSLLKSAVEGKLTQDWREERLALAKSGGPPVENSDQILRKALVKHREYWEARQLAKYTENGKHPPKGWQDKYNAPTLPNTNNLSSLPEGWIWASIEQCALPEASSITDGPFGSNLKSTHYRDFGPRVIRLQNIGDGEFIDAKVHISEEHYAELTKHSVETGDVVVAMLGDNLPKACVIPVGVSPAIVKADCVRIRVNKNLILPSFLNYYLNSQTLKDRVASLIKGVGRPRINIGNIREICVPLPPLEEQIEIQRMLTDKFREIDEKTKSTNISLIQCDAQRKKILDSAFSGQFVDQNPEDEPASVLLERIRQTRQEREDQPRPKRKPRIKKEEGERVKPILEVIPDTGEPMSAADLLSGCGLGTASTAEDIEAFYIKLRNLYQQKAVNVARKDAEDYVFRVVDS